MSEEANRKSVSRDTMVQLDPYSDRERFNIYRHRQTDGQTDDNIVPIADQLKIK